MVILFFLKLLLNSKIKRKPLLLVLMELMLIDICLLVCVMLLLHFKDACVLSFMVFVKKLWRYLSVFWIPGYPGPPAPGSLQWPIFGPGVEQRLKPSGEDPHEEAPHEENDD
jgi:hypothetical protein